jgi:MYXO-CTERM domain-containing protein
MRVLVRLAVLVAIPAVAGTAGAYSYMGAKWRSLPVPYKVDLNSSQELGRETTRQVVEASFAAWGQPACSAFRATFAGEVSGAVANPNDNQNYLLWRYSSWGRELGGSGTIGVTLPVWYTGSGGGTMVDADIQFNGVDYNWTTNPRSWGDVDAQSIVTHEIGHLLGLNHSSDPSATMYFSYQGGTSGRTLAADDVSGVCFIYPTNQQAQCSGTQPCPSGQTCENGTCVAGGGGNGQLGDSCNDPSDCVNQFCVCGESCFCSRGCGTSNPCPSGWDCVPLQGGGGACAPGQSGGTGQLGDPCQSGSQCQNGFCVGITATSGMCSQPCGTTQPCPGGYSCAPLQGGGGACIPGGGTPDGGTPPPDGGTTAPDGGTTASDAGTPRPPQPLGSSCTAAAECQSRWCAYVSDGTIRVCTQSCGATSPCPSGFYCGQLLGGTRGCVVDTVQNPPDGGTVEPPPEAGIDTGPPKPASGGCSAGGSGGSALWVALAVAALMLGRRRRHPRPQG